MPENVNTSPLSACESLDCQSDERPIMVRVDHVSMIFNMASEQLNSLKEYAIALARRELMFKEFRALDDVSFEVRKGDVFGILGTNGSGKSTMLKIVAGVLEPSKGSCAINGNIAPLIELGAGFDMELTARENIYLNGALLGYPRKFISQHFDEIVDFAEIEKFLDMPMKNYSSGMVARIAFAIATIIVPEILIVDEVLSVGDFMFQQKCERRIQSLIKDHGVTVLIVSHNNDQIERLCNKAIWIEKGHTRMIGSAHDVCQTYRVLGGRIGSLESEQCVFDMLNRHVPISDKTIKTIAGEDRYGTAVKLAELAPRSPSKDAIIAPGDQASLCMVATSLSGILDGPVLLTKQDRIPDVTMQSLKRINPDRIFVLGTEETVSPSVLSDLESCQTSALVTRISGSTLHEAAIEAYRFGSGTERSWSETAVISYDGCTGDLISLSPYFHMKRAPLFFNSAPGVIDLETISLLLEGRFTKLIVLGGQISFPDACLQVFEDAGIDIVRFCGNGPYAANELINNWMESQGAEAEGIRYDDLLVASIWNPFDAFAAGSFAGKTSSAFLLDDPQDLDSVAHAIKFILGKNGAVKRLTFLGDETRFTKLDKELLAKAVELAKK